MYVLHCCLSLMLIVFTRDLNLAACWGTCCPWLGSAVCRIWHIYQHLWVVGISLDVAIDNQTLYSGTDILEATQEPPKGCPTLKMTKWTTFDDLITANEKYARITCVCVCVSGNTHAGINRIGWYMTWKHRKCIPGQDRRCLGNTRDARCPHERAIPLKQCCPH